MIQVPSGLGYIDCGSGFCIEVGDPVTGAVTPTPSNSGSGFDYNQLANLIAASTAGTARVISATQPPYSVPGSNLVYNPATGMLASPIGYNAGAVATSLTPLLTVAGLGLLLVVMLAMRKN